jgi:hypothetical protein
MNHQIFKADTSSLLAATFISILPLRLHLILYRVSWALGLPSAGQKKKEKHVSYLPIIVCEHWAASTENSKKPNGSIWWGPLLPSTRLLFMLGTVFIRSYRRRISTSAGPSTDGPQEERKIKEIPLFYPCYFFYFFEKCQHRICVEIPEWHYRK